MGSTNYKKFDYRFRHILVNSSLQDLHILVSILLHHRFAKCAMRTTNGTPTLVYWYAALIKNQNIKTINFKKEIKHKQTNIC